MAKLARNKTVVKRDLSVADTEVSTTQERTLAKLAIERVINICAAEGYRPRTLKDYGKFWTDFNSVIGGVKYIETLTADHFRAYINHLLTVKELSPVTVNIRMNALRALFNRMYKEGIIATNPVASIKKLKTDEQTVGALTDKQIVRLFAQIDKSGFAGYRDYCAMLTMLKCGLRINEVDALEISDIDFENGVILLPGTKNKNRKSRSIPVTNQVLAELDQLIKETRQYFGKTVKHVFVNNVGEPLSDGLIRKRMHDYGVKAGLQGECRFSPHNLRHTFATNFLKAGGNIRALMSILGHSDLSTTQVYLNFTDTDVKEQYNKLVMYDKIHV